MMRTWIELCAAAGFDVTKMKPFDAFLIAGKILNDTSVAHEDRIASLKAMTAEERRAVRERASGVVQVHRTEPKRESFVGQAETAEPPTDFDDRD